MGLLLNRRRMMMGRGDEVIMTSASNPEVMAICYAQGWCASADKMTKTEAEAVANIGTAFRSSNIVHFDEFEYFTGLTEVYDRAFQYTRSLASIAFPKQITRIGVYAFNNSTVNFSTLPRDLTTIADNSFNGCGNLTLSTLPSGLTSLGTNAFYVCLKLQLTEIPTGVSVIPVNCFANCTTIPRMHLHAGITAIQNQGLNRLNQMAILRCDATTAPTLGTDVFTNCGTRVPAADRKLIVPVGSTGYDTGDWLYLQNTLGYTLIYE